MKKNKQNEIGHSYLKGSDLAQREKEVLHEASTILGFTPTKLIGRSAWWGSSQIGAFHYQGQYQGKKAVLKIQGVKPSLSEIYMIKSFAKANKSKLIRPPHLYNYLEWDEKKRYEALVLELIEGDLIVQTPTNENEVRRFFEIYQDYRMNCLKSPWVDKPDDYNTSRIVDAFKKWRETSFKIYPNHPLRSKGDIQLIDTVVKILELGYKNIEPEFVQGHFSSRDLYQVGNEIVLLSNLYWSWRAPLYDAIFAYHWFMYQLSDVKNITPKKVEEQRTLWLNQIYSLPAIKDKKSLKLLKLALLERAAAGLNLDGLSTNPDRPISKYLLESTRQQIKQLIIELENMS